MIKAFSNLRQLYGMVDDAAEALQQGLGVPLCAQCGRCCDCNTPSMLMIEALYAVSILTGSGVLSQVTSLAEGWLLDREDYRIYEGMPIGWSSPALRDEWNTLTRRPCPFLVDKHCLIHEARPLVCRVYGITRVGADFCARPVGRGETPAHKRWVDGAAIRDAREMFLAETKQRNPSWVIRGQIPTLIYQCVAPKKFRSYVKDNKVASAKLIGTDEDASIFWQPQLEALAARGGIGG